MVMIRNCKKCNEEFKVRAGREASSFWCSKTCFYSDYEHSNETREKMRTSHIGKSSKRYPYILHGGYRMLYKPEHLNSNKQGYIFEHRYILSQHIGRPLSKKEVVHHKDENPMNNDISNLELCESAGMHTKKHHPRPRGKQHHNYKHGKYCKM